MSEKCFWCGRVLICDGVCEGCKKELAKQLLEIDRLKAENEKLKAIICEYSLDCDYQPNNHPDYCPERETCPIGLLEEGEI